MNAIGLARDWRTLPLEGDGRCLIEASAGTGKTWTIAALYLRLLLECGLLPQQIVVTTFGIAASQELHERIRARVVDAAMLAEAEVSGAGVTGELPDGSIDGWLLARWRDAGDLATTDRNRLRLALADLDLAPITTLHGLCGKILSDHPFASGGGFAAAELIANDTLDRELRDDLWRRLAQANADVLDAGDRVWFASGRKAFDAALKKACAPGIGVRAVDIDQDAIEEIMQPERANQVRAWYLAHGKTQLIANSVWHRGLAALAAYIDAGDPAAQWPDKMDALNQKLSTPFKKAFVDGASRDPVIAFAQRAVETLRHVRVAAKCTALARYREELLAVRERRLRDRDGMTFDALIERTLRALEGASGDVLAEHLRKAWPGALVDEFQDTDAQQYAILDRIYRDAPGAIRGRLVMIGDPKQAIYRFRGGDIDAYFAARDNANDILPLEVNYRSSAAFVAACNDLFLLAGPALGQGPDVRVHYQPALAGSGPRHGALTFDGSPCNRPLAFHVDTIPDEQNEHVENAGERRDRALVACANQITLMLQERRHRIGGRLLAPGDIAVLLPTNNDIARLRVLLGERNVPCVGSGTQGVFQSDIARELLIVLYAIEHAHQESAVRAALATRLFALDFDALHALLDDPAAWQRHAQRFTAWRQQWQTEGVQAVIQSVCATNAQHLATTANPERLLTDLRHLGELLQQATGDCDGPASLLAWFARQRAGSIELGEDAAEDQQLRIESDARRVRLMTLHRSKGLQFPIVFLPLMWAARGRRPDWPLVRDAATGGRVLDLGGPLHAAALMEDQQADQDERFRVLYVALTRAQHACHVYAIANDSDVDPARSALSALLERLHTGIGERDAATVSAHIAWSEARWPWTQSIYRPLVDTPHPPRHALPLPAARAFLARHSFSTLTSHRPSTFDEDAAIDEGAANQDTIDAVPVSATDEPPHPELTTLAMLRGTAFGNALHAVLEQRVLARPMREQLPLVRLSLEVSGVRLAEPGAEAIVRRIATRLQGLLDAPLPVGPEPYPTLAGLPARRQRAEMEFHYALDAVSVQRLRATCANFGEPDLVPAHAGHVLRGLMNGKIDLVFEHAGRFHVLDYKGNFLGERLADYSASALRIPMEHHHYRFQALLYTIALDRYLGHRMTGYQRSEHLGETIYAFVRAVGLVPGAGIWSHRFSDELLAATGAVFANLSIEAKA